ncbi:hypothetical protein BASA81_004817 [Batrachochytrium salamandrivorans]|nr:hypothetical protein BASA81_004817 [Batrachochytrium salamandrivorans]
MQAIRASSQRAAARSMSSSAPVGEWVQKLNAATRAEDVKDVLSGLKQTYPDANVVFRKELPKRPEPAPLAPGLIEKYKLNLASRYVPLIGGLFALLTSQGYYVVNEETMLLYVFCTYTGVAYAKLRKPAMEMLEANNAALLASFNKAENKKIDALKVQQEEEKEKSTLFSEIVDIPAAKQALKELEAFNQVEASKAELRNKVARSLEAVALLQERLQVEQSRELIAKANQAVLKELSTEAAKKKSFEAALNSLKAPKDSAKSPVLDLFTQYFAKSAKDQAGKPVALHPELKLKIADALASVGLKATNANMTAFAKA